MNGKAKSRFNSLIYALPILIMLVYAFKKAEVEELTVICTEFNGIFDSNIISNIYKQLYLFFTESQTIPTSSLQLVVINILSYATMVMILKVVFNLLQWLISFTNPNNYSNRFNKGE